jgi:hypothetical protein
MTVARLGRRFVAAGLVDRAACIAFEVMAEGFGLGVAVEGEAGTVTGKSAAGPVEVARDRTVLPSTAGRRSMARWCWGEETAWWGTRLSGLYTASHPTVAAVVELGKG